MKKFNDLVSEKMMEHKMKQMQGCKQVVSLF